MSTEITNGVILLVVSLPTLILLSPMLDSAVIPQGEIRC